MVFETDIQRVADQYRAEGYAVVTHPDRGHLPGFPDDLGADILATRGYENVVV